MLHILNVDEEVVAVLFNDSPQACPYWDDLHTERLQDSLSTYEFTCPADHESAQYVVAENYVARLDLDGNMLLFKIKNVNEYSQDGQYLKKVYAENAAISELIADIIRPKTLSNISAPDAMDFILQGTLWEAGEVDYLGLATLTFSNYETALAGLQMLPTSYGGELRYRIELQNRRIYKRYIDLVQRVGKDTGKRFEYAKDIKGVHRVEDSKDLATAIIPLGKADAAGVRMNITSVNNGLDYLADEDARDLWSKGAKHVFGVFIDEKADTPSALVTSGTAELQKRKNPVFTYELDVALLERKTGIAHEDVRLGDGVNVLDSSFEPYLALNARIIEVLRSYTEPLNDKVTLGEFVKQYITIPSIVTSMQKTLTVASAKADAAERVYKGTTPPDDTTLLWLDMSNDKLYVWKKYDDTAQKWIPATTTNFTQVDGQVTQTQISDKAVGSSQIDSNAVTQEHISDSAVGTSQIAPSAVTSTEIASQAITSTAIAYNAVQTVHIEDQAIEAQKIKDQAIDALKLKDEAVTSEKIAPNSINDTHIDGGTITEAKLKWSTHLLF
jgi:phage minor structural protein